LSPNAKPRVPAAETRRGEKARKRLVMKVVLRMLCFVIVELYRYVEAKGWIEVLMEGEL